MITSRPSLSAVTRSDDAASVDDWCTCFEFGSLSFCYSMSKYRSSVQEFVSNKVLPM
jgi:predicted aminopeptidase